MANISRQIKKSTEEIKDIMQLNLATIAESMIDQVIRNAKRLPRSKVLDSTKGVHPTGVNAYKSDLKATLSVVSSEALDQVRKEIPTAKNVKLMEDETRLLFGEFEQLPASIRKRIDNANQLLIGTQISDLEKAIFFQFGSSVASDKTIREIEFDLNEKSEKYITGNAIQAGSSVSAATAVNDARNAFFFDDKVLEEIAAFEFVNLSPVAQICKDLAGKIFPKDDPNHFRYTCPLHFNCKSWYRPILKLKKGQVPERLSPTKAGIKSIQFTENFDNMSELKDS